MKAILVRTMYWALMLTWLNLNEHNPMVHVLTTAAGFAALQPDSFRHIIIELLSTGMSRMKKSSKQYW